MARSGWNWRTEDGHAELGVQDEGSGIPPDDLPFVFDRFYRSSTARAQPGSGLGLAIVRQIAEQHHGTVLAHSRNPGAQLLLRLPLSAARTRTAQPDYADADAEPDFARNPTA